MSSNFVRITVFSVFLCFAAAAAEAQVCVRIDESHDTLSQDDRTAAVLLLGRQFALAGEQVAADCATPYVLTHIKLGNTITVTLSGPKGDREGTALGLDDLPALYSQMVRSIETGRPMTGFGVVDRTNVTAAQATAQRVHSDGFMYARLGYSGIFGDRIYGVPSFGLGYRAELDKVAIDVTPDGDPMDDHGHGTHVSGTIAARLNNPTGDPAAAEGVVGVAPNVRLLAYKVCAFDGTCSDFAIEQALAQAVTDGAKVINMSLGGAEYSRSLDDAVQAAWNAGLVIVAGAGNDGTTDAFYPAALDNVVSVAAFDEDDRRAAFSNYGSWVDLSAPGNVIMSTYPLAACAASGVPGDTGCYTWLSGTSMATPHVSGAAALVWSRSDVTSNSQVVDILLHSADPNGVDSVHLDTWTIHGGLNLHNALSYGLTNQRPVANAGADQTLTDDDGDGVQLVTLDGSASSDPDGGIVSYEWREGATVIGFGATPAVWLSVGIHTLTLEVKDAFGDSGTDSAVITINALNHPPIAGNTTASTVVGTPVTVTLNATDVDTCELGFAIVQGPASGALGDMANQACVAGTPNSDTVHMIYMPGTAAGTYSFTYNATDGSADSNVATVTITVNAPVYPPIAGNTTASTVVGTPVTVTLNATDVDTCELGFAVVQGPASGALGTMANQPCVAGTPNSDAVEMIYTPGTAVGTYSFTYNATDGSADSNVATVTITVNAPVPPPTTVVSVTGINPNVVSQNAGIISFVITGTGFAGGAGVTFANGSGPAPRVINVRQDSSTQLTASVEIRPGGPKKNRLWDVVVTNPGGSTGAGVRLLTITP